MRHPAEPQRDIERDIKSGIASAASRRDLFRLTGVAGAGLLAGRVLAPIDAAAQRSEFWRRDQSPARPSEHCRR